MVCGVRRGGLGLTVVLVVTTMAMAMTSPVWGQQCNFRDLMPCLKSVKGAYPPRPDPSCCGVVMDVNPACMCSEVADFKDANPSYIKNGLAIPKACGRYELSGYRCGIYTIE